MIKLLPAMTWSKYVLIIVDKYNKFYIFFLIPSSFIALQIVLGKERFRILRYWFLLFNSFHINCGWLTMIGSVVKGHSRIILILYNFEYKRAHPLKRILFNFIIKCRMLLILNVFCILSKENSVIKLLFFYW